MKAKQIMVPKAKVIAAAPSDSIRSVSKRLAEGHVSGAPVLEGGKVVGVISESDIVRFLNLHVEGDDLPGKLRSVSRAKVRDVMTKGAIWVEPDAPLDEVADKMAMGEVNRVLVVNERMELLGLIARSDLIRSAFGGKRGD